MTTRKTLRRALELADAGAAKKQRARAGLTQRELAALLGIHEIYGVRFWELEPGEQLLVLMPPDDGAGRCLRWFLWARFGDVDEITREHALRMLRAAGVLVPGRRLLTLPRARASRWWSAR